MDSTWLTTSTSNEDEEVVRKDGCTDGGGVVLPSLVRTTRETEAALEKADRALDARSESLCDSKLWFVFAFGLNLIATPLLGNSDDLDVTVELGELLRRPVALVGCDAFWKVPEELLVARQGWADEGRLDRFLPEHLVVGDELLSGLLDLDHVTELNVLAGLATLEEFGVVLEDAKELVLVRDRAFE